REVRWSLVEPLVFLGIVRMYARSRTAQGLLLLSLLAAGTVASVHGLFDIVTDGGVSADNVRRLSGPLPHPNALALFLVKVFVLGATTWIMVPRWRVALLVPVALT